MLFSMVILGMFGVGYQASIAGSSRKSWLTPVMILTFSLMITLISALDRPNSDLMPVPQQPLADLRAWMD
jgi:protein-S-isoprenylcysteine O-methyltransferase Ste14